MNDELILNNYLLVLKSTVEVYVHGTLESSNIDVRSLLNNNLNAILKMQASVYDTMVECNFYTVNNINSSEIKKTINSINK